MRRSRFGLYYVLDEQHNVVEVTDVKAWGEFFQDIEKRRVAETQVPIGFVSTVFLGLDHGHMFGEEGPPIVFETMAFRGDDCRDPILQWRYATWDEAIAGHERAVEACSGDPIEKDGDPFDVAWQEIKPPDVDYVEAREAWREAGFPEPAAFIRGRG